MHHHGCFRYCGVWDKVSNSMQYWRMTIRFVSVSISLKFHLIPSHSIEFPSSLQPSLETTVDHFASDDRAVEKVKWNWSWREWQQHHSTHCWCYVHNVTVIYWHYMARTIIRMISKLYFFFNFFPYPFFLLASRYFFLEFFIHSDWLQYFFFCQWLPKQPESKR